MYYGQIEVDKGIKSGEVVVEPGTDAMSLVFGNEKGRSFKGVGFGVSRNKYFGIPRTRGPSTKKVTTVEKDEHIKKVTEENEYLRSILAQAQEKGIEIPGFRIPTESSAAIVRNLHVFYPLQTA